MRYSFTKMVLKISVATLTLAGIASSVLAATSSEDVTKIYDDIKAKCTTSKASVVQAPAPAPAPEAPPPAPQPEPQPVPALW